MSWMVFPGNPALSALVLAPIVIAMLYFARDHVHGLLASLTRLPAGSLRMGAKWLSSAADSLRERNKIVLISQAREAVEKELEREFERVSVAVVVAVLVCVSAPVIELPVCVEVAVAVLIEVSV